LPLLLFSSSATSTQLAFVVQIVCKRGSSNPWPECIRERQMRSPVKKHVLPLLMPLPPIDLLCRAAAPA
jgi:hypothetical protein